MYDEDEVHKIYNEKLPKVLDLLTDCIKDGDALKDLETAMNTYKWHLIPKAQKKDCLCKMLKIDEDRIDKSYCDFVFSPYNQGYKLLWFISHLLMIQYEMEDQITILKENIKKIPDVSDDKNINRIIDFIIEISKTNPEDLNIQEYIQVDYIKQLQKVMDMYDLDRNLKVKTLYSLTKESAATRRIFWECFDWDAIKITIESAKDVKTC